MTVWDEALNVRAAHYRDLCNSQFNAGSFIRYEGNTLPRFLPSSGRFVCADCGLSHPDMGQAIICDHSGNVVPIRKLEEAMPPPLPRTPEQITAEMEARLAELEAEANRPEKLFPCDACKHSSRVLYIKCHHPLIKGFGDAPFVDLHDGSFRRNAGLCGPEKALWEPKPPKRSLWARFVDWFIAPWRESVPD